MKRLLLLTCCILLVVGLCSCSSKRAELQEPVNFYYANAKLTYNSPTGVLAHEAREGAGFHGNLSAFLHAYLRGPSSPDLEGTIPSDVYLVSWEMDNDMVIITFSSQFSTLSGLKLTTACSALLLTVHDYIGMDTICVRAKGEKLDGKDSITLSIDDVVLIDTADFGN